MKNDKKLKLKKKNIIIFLDILFLICCVFFYGFRLIHYYKIENPKIDKKLSLYEMVTLEKNITSIASGLYKEKDTYYYKGKDINNYVLYSGRIWRVISVDKDNNIKLISDESQTSLVFGVDSNYENSYIRSWLNDSDNDIKSFYESLENTNILVDTQSCTDVIEDKKITCDKIVKDKVGLLSAYEYEKAGGADSYLNINKYWWTSSVNSSNTAWYVYSKGSLNDNSFTNKTYFSYGVRPTITIKGSTIIKSGDGSKNNPIFLDETTTNLLNTKIVGNYLTYSGYNFRIIEKSSDYVKVVMDGVIKEDKEDYFTNFGQSNYITSSKDVGKYLNTTFYNSLSNKEYILKHNFYSGRYDSGNKYDFNQIDDYNESYYVGLLQLGELFVNDESKYFLSTRTKTTENSIYQVLDNGRIYAGAVTDELRLRPTLYLKPDLTVNSGTGTKSDPYIIE